MTKHGFLRSVPKNNCKRGGGIFGQIMKKNVSLADITVDKDGMQHEHHHVDGEHRIINPNTGKMIHSEKKDAISESDEKRRLFLKEFLSK